MKKTKPKKPKMTDEEVRISKLSKLELLKEFLSKY